MSIKVPPDDYRRKLEKAEFTDALVNCVARYCRMNGIANYHELLAAVLLEQKNALLEELRRVRSYESLRSCFGDDQND